ncbi:MAG: nickel-dependent hydrogenase large subunit [Spirochaetales bacterium]|nr:nickel-dependent hydrogenase large subunit [Spirochaetales bacterium]
MSTIIIDPLTRIEGHLKVEVDVNNGSVTDARVSGTMARGIEKLLKGRDPRDAVYVTERICGVCFAAHGWTSSLAVEMAHGTAALPDAARVLRNLIVGACWLHDHVLHFYHLSALDYLDLGVLINYKGSDPFILKIKDLITNETDNPPVEGEYAGPFLPAYRADDYCVKDVKTVAVLVQHYLDALAVQAKAKKMSAVFSGKQPHQSGIIVGGVTQLPNPAQIGLYQSLLQEVGSFINNVYLNDVVFLAEALWPLAASDLGAGYRNYLSYGGFPCSDGSFLYPEGAIVEDVLTAGTRAEMEPAINEDVTKAWYEAGTDGHPSISTQEFDPGKAGAYTFVKAPRFAGRPMEVGPLARMMVASRRQEHLSFTHPSVQQFISLLGRGMMPGALARHAARALETSMLCDAMVRWISELTDLCDRYRSRVIIHDTEHWDPPETGIGYGMTEAPRGALGHWVRIDGRTIGNYSCVVPTTWNASPADGEGIRGPFEQALIGTPVADISNPVNIGRVIRSFDPCLACAVHLHTPEGNIREWIVP